jgi:hypothetical protein
MSSLAAMSKKKKKFNCNVKKLQSNVFMSFWIHYEADGVHVLWEECGALPLSSLWLRGSATAVLDEDAHVLRSSSEALYSLWLRGWWCSSIAGGCEALPLCSFWLRGWWCSCIAGGCEVLPLNSLRGWWCSCITGGGCGALPLSSLWLRGSATGWGCSCITLFFWIHYEGDGAHVLREDAKLCLLIHYEGDGAHVLREEAGLCCLFIHSGYNAMLDEDAEGGFVMLYFWINNSDDEAVFLDEGAYVCGGCNLYVVSFPLQHFPMTKHGCM